MSERTRKRMEQQHPVRRDHVIPFDFELGTYERHEHRFRVETCYSSFVLLSVEGTLLGDADRGALAACELSVDLSKRRMFCISLDLITPHDSVLEARVRRIESMFDGILQLELPEGVRSDLEQQMARRADALRRLGWKPYDAVDHRRLNAPFMAQTTEDVNAVVTCDTTKFSTPVPWRLTLRGVVTEHEAFL